MLCACVLCCAVLLLLMGSVLCVERCGGVRRARAVRESVLETRARLRCCVRAGVCWMVYCVVRLFTVLWSASLAGRAARWAAARCGWLSVCLVVCGGRSARPTRSSAAQGASMPMRAACEAAVRLARKVSVRRGTRVCVHAAGAGGRGRRRGLTAVRCRLVFGVARAGA